MNYLTTEQPTANGNSANFLCKNSTKEICATQELKSINIEHFASVFALVHITYVLCCSCSWRTLPTRYITLYGELCIIIIMHVRSVVRRKLHANQPWPVRIRSFVRSLEGCIVCLVDMLYERIGALLCALVHDIATWTNCETMMAMMSMVIASTILYI